MCSAISLALFKFP